MIINTEDDIIRLVREDDWMMDVLHTAQALQLPDWWVCAGFVRSKLWDTLHGYRARTPLSDVDVIYYDAGNMEEAEEKKCEQRLRIARPSIPWSVKNQARMHLVSDAPPYSSSVDAMSKFPETATALGLTIDERGRLVLAAPCGIEDVLRMAVKPTPFFEASDERIRYYKARLAKKNWESRWPKIHISSPRESYGL
ncbi:nucleotidyltransferase family protein [Paenibacillus harenae]|uniref:nucleotidyltransferase family protein n=1 Tax=Paenibacillus harenae TaxID=306543 RepID=UPI000403B5E4|nr:nucleotidyltransferase family protein [Paenibacillus harenae]